MKDGIYFDLPEAHYHDLPRLSASGIKSILVSLPTFWARSWMNPHREPRDDDTLARILGRAYHTAIFEPDALGERFACEPDWAEYGDDLIATDTAVKAALKDLGEVQTKAGEVAIDRAQRLSAAGDWPIKSLIQQEFDEALGDRQSIAPDYWAQIQRDVQRIADNPEISKMTTDGAAEVTILWTDPDTGIPMKARLDKLHARRIVDLKSFTNTQGKAVNQAIADQVQYNRYYISMRVYQIAARMIGHLDLPVIGEATNDQAKLVEALKRRVDPLETWILFQEKGGIPNLLLRQLKLQSLPDGVEEQMIGADDATFRMNDGILCQKADLEIRHAMRRFSQAMDVYGDEGAPWYPPDMVGEIGDGDFSAWFLDGAP